jgi:hypothetical protein
MTLWMFLVGIVSVGLLWLFLKRLWLGSTEGDDAVSIKACLTKQAQKREGRVHVRDGQYTLTFPYQSASIDVSAVISSEEVYRECTCATVRIDNLTDKEFKVLLDSDSLLLKPLVIGTRLKLEDELFNEAYIVVANDPALIKNLFTPDVRDKLRQAALQVKLGRRFNAAILDREQGWLSVFTQGLRVEDGVVDVLVETTMLLYDRLKALNEHHNTN